MKVITLSAFEELKQLQDKGFRSEVTKATDGTDIILAQNDTGLSRIFNIYDVKEETWEAVEMEEHEIHHQQMSLQEL